MKVRARALACLLVSIVAEVTSAAVGSGGGKKMDAVGAPVLPTFFPVTGFGGSGTRAVR
jgi:hypothetical protein